MVQVVLQDKSIRNLEKILAKFVEDKLVINPSIVEELRYQHLQGGNFLKYKFYRLTAISRTILTHELSKCIEEVNESNALEFYTVPIVDMDWKQSSAVKGFFDHVKMVS